MEEEDSTVLILPSCPPKKKNHQYWPSVSHIWGTSFPPSLPSGSIKFNAILPEFLNIYYSHLPHPLPARPTLFFSGRTQSLGGGGAGWGGGRRMQKKFGSRFQPSMSPLPPPSLNLALRNVVPDYILHKFS